MPGRHRGALLVGILGLLVLVATVGELRLLVRANAALGPTPNAEPPKLPGPAYAQPAAPVDPLLTRLERSIRSREYWASESGERLRAPNRRHDMFFDFDASGVKVHDHAASAGPQLVALRLAGIGRDAALRPVGPGLVRHEAGRIEIERPALGLVEWFENSEAGLEHGFTIARRLASPSRPEASAPSSERRGPPAQLVVELSIESAVATGDGDAVRLTTEAGRSLSYAKLVVVDARERQLAARFEVPAPDRVRLIVDDAEASYPIVVDPILTGTADAQLESNASGASLGMSVASAGDVNGDGFDDLIVGAPFAFPSVAYIYHGGPAGVGSGGPLVADTALTSANPAGTFAMSVASAGDVDGDGYDDVIVGDALAAGPGVLGGAAMIYRGGPGGIPSGNTTTASTRLESQQDLSQFGAVVSSAGDIDGDGFDDVVVGAPNYDNGEPFEGAAFVFRGSATGIPNGNPGTAHAILESNQADARLSAVASAGDVNADGYDDVIVGASLFDNGTEDEGAAFVFLGSASGIANGSPATAATILESNQAAAGGGAAPGFGYSVSSAGDVDGDGYDDVIVGAPGYDGAPALPSVDGIDQGHAFVFRGSAVGVASGHPGTAAARFSSNQGGLGGAAARLGESVASAGDVNGDGFADVVVGAQGYDADQADEGAAWVYLGAAASAGGSIPFTLIQRLEANQTFSGFGFGVASAGDVNGDGLDDVVVGAPNWNGGLAGEGAAFVHHGEPFGLIYREGFVGESAFPTVPEIDLLALGGLSTDVIASSIVLDGIAARMSVAGIAPFGNFGLGIANVIVNGPFEAAVPLVVSATFEDLEISAPGFPRANLGYQIQATLVGGRILYRLTYSGQADEWYFASEDTLGVPTLIATLSAEQRLAVETGASVRISLTYDESAGAVRGSLSVDGFPAIESPSSAAAFGDSVSSVLAAAFVSTLLPIEPGSIDVDLRSIEIAAPEPGLFTQLMAGGLALAMLHGRGRPRSRGGFVGRRPESRPLGD